MDTLTRIRAFIDVVDAEGFSAAARRVGRSKALLSKYVRELEDELGALLLNRTTRQFSLTEAGHTYYRTASEILKEIDNLADLVRASNSDLKGRLRISAPRTFVDAEIGQSLIDFGKAHPELSLEIVSDDRFVDLVEEGFDVAIRITKLEDSTLIARKLDDFQVQICASPEFLEKIGPINHPSELSRHACIIDTNGRSYSNWRFVEPDGTTLQRPGRRSDRGQQPARRRARRRIRHRHIRRSGIHRPAEDRRRHAGTDPRRLSSQGPRHLCDLSASALPADEGADLRRLSSCNWFRKNT